jgi:hypothetical protein
MRLQILDHSKSGILNEETPHRAACLATCEGYHFGGADIQYQAMMDM